MAVIADKRSAGRFLVVGLTNTLINLAVFTLAMRVLPESPAGYMAAQLACYTPGVLWSYFWNRRWSFESADGHGRLFWRFVASQAVFAVLSGLSIQQLVAHTAIARTMAWLLVSAAVTVLNYLALRHVVFPRGSAV